MPLYEYRCADCGHQFEALVAAGRADHEACPDCGTEARRLLSLVAAPVRGGDGAAMPVAGGGGGCCGGACGNCRWSWRAGAAEMPTELEAVAAEAAGCTRCRLYESRTQVVFGQGDPAAELMFVGEAPGFHEDRQGLPFVGPSGQLLNRLLEGIGLRRQDAYVCNVVKSRPPRNRDPQPDEIAACRPWLDAQIRLVDPKVVVTLGNFAAKTLLETTTGITRLRGQSYPFQGRVLLPTFHPAAALHAQGRRTAGPSPLQAMEDDFRVLAGLLAGRRPTAPPPEVQTAPPEPDPPPDRPPDLELGAEGEQRESEQLGLF